MTGFYMLLEHNLGSTFQFAEYAIGVVMADMLGEFSFGVEADAVWKRGSCAVVAPESKSAMCTFFVLSESASGVISCSALNLGYWVYVGAWKWGEVEMIGSNVSLEGAVFAECAITR
jgi:hypothetical protein